MTVVLIKSLSSPDHLLAPSQGNVQLLPNGNVFVNWGQAGAVTEFRANDSVPIFHARLDSGPLGGVQSYRGFRFNWTGIPYETPAIVSLTTSRASKSLAGEETTIYVSWNGDTETVAWRFYAAIGDLSTCRSPRSCSSTKLLGQAQRTSFETAFKFDAKDVLEETSGPLRVFAEAVDKDDRVIGSTAFTRTHPDPLSSHGANSGRLHLLHEQTSA